MTDSVIFLHDLINEVPVIQFGVLADDLTGALASAARLREAGLRPVVTWRPQLPTATATALVADMRTRDYGSDPCERARTWARHLVALGCARVELRIDSTLRGEPAAELRGVLAALGGPPDPGGPPGPGRPHAGGGLAAPGGADLTVLAVPAFPSAGRVVRDGLLEVAGQDIPAARCDIARQVFGGYRAQAARIGLEVIGAGAGAVAARIREQAGAGRRFLVADATCEEHLQAVAEAAGLIEEEARLRLVTVSPGAWLRYRRPEAPQQRFTLVVLSSKTAANEAQLRTLTRTHRCLVLSARDVLAGRRQLDIPAWPAVVVVETLSEAASDPAEAWVLSVLASRAASHVLDEATAAGAACQGAVVGGGQTASALMDALGAGWLEAAGELAPLCPLSRVRGGPYAGLPVVTKGGLVGSGRTLAALVTALRGGETGGEEEGARP